MLLLGGLWALAHNVPLFAAGPALGVAGIGAAYLLACILLVAVVIACLLACPGLLVLLEGPAHKFLGYITTGLCPCDASPLLLPPDFAVLVGLCIGNMFVWRLIVSCLPVALMSTFSHAPCLCKGHILLLFDRALARVGLSCLPD